MHAFVHDVPASRVVFAVGAVREVRAEVERLGGRRVMLIAGSHDAVTADTVAAYLGDLVASRFGEVVMHVPTEVAGRAIDAARTSAADTLVCVGGGSATGLAKAVAKELRLAILAVPTTYAGSEMTPIWGTTEHARKVTGRDSAVLPRTVIYDPALTIGLPAALSASSGMNALAHLVEGLYAPEVSPPSFLLAAEGVRALASALPRVAADPADLVARSDALYGAWLAGWTLGTTGMGVHHKIAHTLGGTFDLPHAPAHAALLPYSVAFNESSAPAAMAATLAGLAASGFAAESAAGAVWDLAVAIGAPTSLTAIGFRASDIDEAARMVVDGRPVNPRPVELDGVRALLTAACAGARPA